MRVNPLFVAHSFLYGGRSQDYPRIGEILESENKSVLVGLNQELYIKAEQELVPGELLTVMGRSYRFDRNGHVGDVIQYQGQVRVDVLRGPGQ